MGGSGDRRGIVLLAVCAATVLLPFSMVGVSVALPSIGVDLHNGLAAGQWVINAYDVAFASLMLAAGSLADTFGRRRVFRIGMTAFVASAAVCAIAPNIVVLDVARAVGGAGAAAALTSGSALLASAFTGAQRARAFGVFGTAVGLGLALSPTLAGLLVGTLGWRWVFAVPAVIGAVALALTPKLPESRNPKANRVDVAGTLTFTGALGVFVLALVEGPQLGWDSPVVLGGFVGFVALLGAFVVVERRQEVPMFDMSLLTRRRFVGLCLLTVVFVTVFTPLAVDLPSYLIAVNGIGALQAGAILLALGVPTVIFPAVAGYLTRWIAARYQLIGAVALTGIGAAWLTVIQPGIGIGALVGPLGLIGMGIGISFGLLDAAAVSSVEPERVGMAAGMFNTTRLGGEAIAIAVVGSLLVSFTGSGLRGGLGAAADQVANLLNQGEPAVAMSTGGMDRGVFVGIAEGGYTGALHTVLWVLVACCAVAIPVASWLVREPASAQGVDVSGEQVGQTRERKDLVQVASGFDGAGGRRDGEQDRDQREHAP